MRAASDVRVIPVHGSPHPQSQWPDPRTNTPRSAPKSTPLYGQQPEPAADYEIIGMARLRLEVHARMLGNGLCTELDCRMESACETCAYFRTTARNRSGDLPHG
jgi:hypothetical protein